MIILYNVLLYLILLRLIIFSKSVSFNTAFLLPFYL